MSRLSGAIVAVVCATVNGIPLGYYEGHANEMSKNDVFLAVKSANKADFVWNFSMDVVGLRFDFDCKDVDYTFDGAVVSIPQEGNPCIQSVAATFAPYFVLQGAMKMPYDAAKKSLHLLTGLANCVDVHIAFQKPIEEPVAPVIIAPVESKTDASAEAPQPEAPKEEQEEKETPTEVQKETPTEEKKEAPKEEVKETPKEEVKEAPKEEVKVAPKEEKSKPVKGNKHAPEPVTTTTAQPAVITEIAAEPVVFVQDTTEEPTTTTTTTKGANGELSFIATTTLLVAVIAMVM